MKRTLGLEPSINTALYLQESQQTKPGHNPYKQLVQGIYFTAERLGSSKVTRLDLENFSYNLQFIHRHEGNHRYRYNCYLWGSTPKGVRTKVYITHQLATDIVYLEKALDKARIYPYYLPPSSKMAEVWKIGKDLAETLFSCKISRKGVTYCRFAKEDRQKGASRRAYHLKASLEMYPGIPEQQRLMMWAMKYLRTRNAGYHAKRARFRKVLVRQTQDT
jgi:hypothetical protein